MNVYEVTNEILSDNKLDYKKFNEKYRNRLETENDKYLYDLLRNLASLSFKVEKGGGEFKPRFAYEGRRSFAIEDISEIDYAELMKLDIVKLPNLLRARIADIIWETKKDYKYASIAAEAYYEHFANNFDEERWLTDIKIIKRAVSITLKLNNKTLYSKCCDIIYDKVQHIDIEREDMLIVSLLEILVEQNYDKQAEIIGIIDSIIAEHKSNIYKIEKSYNIKLKCKRITKDETMFKSVANEFADTYVNFSRRETVIFRKTIYLEKAIMLYRNNGQKEKAEETHKELIDVQKKIPGTMKSFSYTIDLKDIYIQVENAMKGATLEEAIILLGMMTVLYKKADIQKELISDKHDSIIGELFPKVFINKNGQAVATLPSLNIDNPEEDKELLDMHTFDKLNEKANLYGNTILRCVIKYIKDNYNISADSVAFLVNKNAIIPSGRENVMGAAISFALNGKMYEALHILAPQVENLFRELAKELDATTVTLEKDGMSKAKVLSSIFELPELLENYDNDILFLFRGLMNEQVGANIRNNIAHGLLDEAEAFQGTSIYFVCAIIKLLVLTSNECNNIYQNSKLLKSQI